MTPAQARALAEEALADMRQRNASYPHPESVKVGKFAGIVVDLCNQIEALTPPPAVEDAPTEEPKPKRGKRNAATADDKA